MAARPTHWWRAGVDGPLYVKSPTLFITIFTHAKSAVVSTAHSLLAVFAPDPSDLTGLLVRLALSDNSTSSTAVLHAALALAALHKYGAQTDIYAFKDRALQTLLGSCSPDNAANKGMVAQHMAASMLLCHLEMLGLPNTVPLWFCHLRHAKTLIDNVVVGVHDAVSFDSEFPGLVGWVEYHTVLARFSIRHWYRYEGEARKGVKTSTVAVAEQGGCQPKKTKDVAHGAHEIVQLMGFLFGTLLSSTDEHFHDEEYEQTLRCLENRISHLETGGVDNKSWSATVELLKLSALIYLKRASRNFSGTSSEIDALVERAHCLLDDVKQAPAFTLLIIGCEARSDEQRKKMLKYAERARKMSSLRSIQQVRDILQKVWIQDDLAVDDYELDYIGRLDTGITSFKMMPSFA